MEPMENWKDIGMTFTIEDIQKFVAENREDLNRSLQECDEIPSFRKHAKPDDHIGKMWDSGSWLSKTLRELGASDEEKEAICFAHGQRCFGGDPFEVALSYANEYADNKTTSEQPGPELAEKIFNETIGRVLNGGLDQ